MAISTKNIESYSTPKDKPCEIVFEMRPPSGSTGWHFGWFGWLSTPQTIKDGFTFSTPEAAARATAKLDEFLGTKRVW